ncbi:MAG: hypothetical protein HYV32_06465 [Candidatus Kerfeldbacteria bacterium]|nr:hypothetical protein [Candidatus Kerfeldbacteria bacterium]
MSPVSIQNIIEYYTSAPEYESDLYRAVLNFFDVQTIADAPAEISAEVEMLFNEWLIFHFQLTSGRTLLAEYCERNPHQLSVAELAQYIQMRDTHFYSFFEVERVRLGKGLTMRDIHSGKKYIVQERMGTLQLHAGNVIFARLIRQDKAWNIMSGTTPMINIQLSDDMRQHLRGGKNDFLTPQYVYRTFYAANKTDANNAQKTTLNPELVRQQMHAVLKRCRLHSMVSVETIQEWITNEVAGERETIMPILIGLLDERCSTEAMNELLRAVQDLHNITPLKSLAGKSPQDMVELLQNVDAPIDRPLRVHVTNLGNDEWLQHEERAREYLQQQQYEQAIQEFETCFTILLKQHLTNREVYRLFTNTAIAYLANGHEQIGRRIVDMSLQLNPNYDFGQETKRRLNNGELDDMIDAGRMMRLQERVERGVRPLKEKLLNAEKYIAGQPSGQYFDWLQTLHIQFATKHRTKSKTIPYRIGA